MTGEGLRTGPSEQDKSIFLEWFENFGNSEFIVASPKPVGEGDAQVYIPLEIDYWTKMSLTKLIGELTIGIEDENFNIPSIAAGNLRHRTRWHHQDPSVFFMLVYVSHLRGTRVHREVASVRRVVTLENERVGVKDYSIRRSGQSMPKVGRMTSPNYPPENLSPQQEIARLMYELSMSLEEPLGV